MVLILLKADIHSRIEIGITLNASAIHLNA